MKNEFLRFDELSTFLIKQFQKCDDKKEKIEVIKRFLVAIVKRKQFLSTLFDNFQITFALAPTLQIKKYLYELKNLYDNGKDLDENLVLATCLFVLNNSVLSENSILYTKIPDKI